MFFNLSEHNSIASRFLLELRDQHVQSDRMRFRNNLQRLGEILAYEISRTLSYHEKGIQTPLALTKANDLSEEPVLISILRAGIPFLQGFANFFDKADTGFIGAYRDESNQTLTVKMDYQATPDVKGKVVILIDPMLATGGSLVAAIRKILEKGRPEKIHVASVIAAPEGIQVIKDFFQNEKNISYAIWTAAVDSKLNHLFYIVPGLGDAGDLSYGVKTQ